MNNGLAIYASIVSSIVAIKEILDYFTIQKNKNLQYFKEISIIIGRISYSSTQDDFINEIENINRIFDYEIDNIKKIKNKNFYIDFKTEIIEALELLKYNISLDSQIYSSETFYQDKKNIDEICRSFTKNNL